MNTHTLTPFLLGLLTCFASVKAEIVEMAPFSVHGTENAFTETGSPITFIETDELQTFRFKELTDLHGLVPNLRVGSGGLRSFGGITQMRGIGNTPYFGSPGVSMILDGVALGDSFANPALLPNTQQIVIFRGPQPTLSGRAAPAGTIIINSASPSNKLTAYAEAEFSRFNSRSFTINSSIPIIQDTLWISLAGLYEESDGFIYNTFLNKKTDYREGQLGSVKVRWKPDNSWEIEAGASLEDYDDGAQRIVPTSNPWATDSSNVAGVSESNRNSQYLRASKAFDAFTVKLVLPRNYWELNPLVVDYDLTSFDALTSTLTQEQERFIPELRFESPMESDSAFSWLTGLSYTDAETTGTFMNVFTIPVGGGAVYQGFEDTRHRINEEAFAAYGEVSYNLIDTLKLTAGMRYDTYSKKLHRDKATDQGPRPSIPLKKSDDHVSPVFAMQWEATEHLTLNARYAHSIQPGGFSAYTDQTALTIFDSERVRSYEIGAALDAIPDKLRVIVSLFHYDLRDYQVERSFTIQDYYVVNAPEAISRGIELELAATPAEGLELAASAGFLKTEFETYFDPNTGVDYGGNRFPYAPEIMLTLSAKYTVPSGPLKGLFGSMLYRYTGATYYDEQENPAFEANAYRLLSARVGYEQDNWGVYLFVENLLNEEYYTHILSIPPNLIAGVPGEPRMVGVGAFVRY